MTVAGMKVAVTEPGNDRDKARLFHCLHLSFIAQVIYLHTKITWLVCVDGPFN